MCPVPVQINGKLRAKINIAPDASQAQMIDAAMADKHVDAAIGNKQVVKKIAVPGRMVNLVVK